MKKISFSVLIILSLFIFTGCNDSDRDVSISLPSGTYYGEQHVTLSTPDPNAQITYTLDGSDPGSSVFVYNPEQGLYISYSSELKATAGSNVAEAQYEIIPYPTEKDEAAQAFYDEAKGSYSTDDSYTDNFILKASTISIQQLGQTEINSRYLLKDVNGTSANLVYTNNEGANVEVPISYDAQNHQLTVDGKVYTNQRYLY